MERIGQGGPYQKPDTSVESNQESETDTEPTPLETKQAVIQHLKNNEADTGSNEETQQSPSEQGETPSFSCAVEGWNVAPKLQEIHTFSVVIF